MSIGSRVRSIRKERGLSQVAFSSLLGISHGALQAYESGSSIPGGKALTALAELGVDVNWLLTGKAPKGERTAGEGFMVSDNVQDSGGIDLKYINGTVPRLPLIEGVEEESVDPQLLTQSIQVVEDFLGDNVPDATSSAKAKMIVLVYEIVEHGGDMTLGILKKIAALALGVNVLLAFII